jgi:ubiquinone/menaquinone biosynthesis C-methylase UbiE
MDGESMLKSAGLRENDIALEVGCGPGFFTIPAAKIVGDNGFIYAIDINPFAIKKVDKKLEREGIKNAKTMLVDVTESTLDNESITIALFFGVIHSLMDVLDETLNEMHRILENEGSLVIQKSWKSTEDIIQKITEKDLFELMEEKKRMIIFKKIDKVN